MFFCPKKNVYSYKHQIKEIAEQLQLSYRAYVHKVTGKMMIIPDLIKLYDLDTEYGQEYLDKLGLTLKNNVTMNGWKKRAQHKGSHCIVLYPFYPNCFKTIW